MKYVQSVVSALILRSMGGLALIGLALLAGCKPAPVQQQFTGPIMGTSYHVTVIMPSDDQAKRDKIAQGIHQTLVDIDLKMSTYKPDSELSRFNRAQPNEWFAVSDKTEQVVREALSISQLSGGAFDVTVGPLVNLWGFGPDHRPSKTPDADMLAAAFQRVGYHAVQTRAADQIQTPATALFKTKAVYVDLSAIAKGYAVDQVANYLSAQQLNQFIVEVGGEIRVKGLKPDGTPWRIAIEKPVSDGQVVQSIIGVTDIGIATSGSYRNYFEFEGQRFSHTIDPKTGRPITHKLASVTVLHANCSTADALATTLMVLGPDAGFKFAQQHQLAVYMLVKTDEGFDELQTPEFKELIR